MAIKANQKIILDEIKTLYSWLQTLNEKMKNGSIVEIKRWTTKVEAQATWISILVREIYGI